MVNTRLVAIAAIIIIIVIGIAAWYMTQQQPQTPTPTPTTSPSPTPTPSPTSPAPATSPSPTPTPEVPELKLTGDIEKDVVTVAKYLVAHGVTGKVTFTVWGAGDPNSVLRTLALVEAAARLNKILEANNVDLRIEVKQRYERGGGNELYQEYLSAYQQEQNPDIMANSYIHVAALAEDELILDITDYVQAYKELFDDFYPALMEAVKWKGRIYAIPQDTEARPLYWRIDVAQCIKEKTGQDILADLAEKVEKGQVTWKEVYEYAKLAKETGCAKWGMIHRKGTAHPDLIQFIFAFGGTLYDEATGKLVLDVPAVYKWFSVEYAFARAGLTPENMMEWDWGKQIHPTVVNGETLVFIGGTWHWTEWQTKPYHRENRPLTPEEVKKYFYYTLFPAGEPGQKPVTLSQPFVWYIAANAGKENPKYEELKEAYHMLAFLLVVKASDADLNAIHSIISSHLPVRKAAAELIADKEWVDKLAKLELDLTDQVKEAIKDIVAATVNPINVEFLADASYMLEYTHLTPKHPFYGKFAGLLADAIAKVLRGEMTPEQAIDYLVKQIKADPDLKDSVEIKGEIPSGWSFP